MAAKLARLIYRMLRYGMKYADPQTANYPSQAKSRPPRITNHRSCSVLKITNAVPPRSSWREFLQRFFAKLLAKGALVF